MCIFSTVVSKPSDCIFPYDFKDAVRKKVMFDFLCMSHLLNTNTMASLGIKHVASFCINNRI